MPLAFPYYSLTWDTEFVLVKDCRRQQLLNRVPKSEWHFSRFTGSRRDFCRGLCVGDA